MSESIHEENRSEEDPQSPHRDQENVTGPVMASAKHPSSTASWKQHDTPTIDNKGPMAWPAAKKRSTISLISSLTFLASMAATIFAPGVPALMQEFHSHNEEVAAFVVSIYVIGFGVGPLVLAPLSELYGRAVLLHCSNVGLVAFSIACAVSHNLGLFTFLRLMMGVAGCVPVTIGGGVIADIVPLEKRGAAMSFWGMGPILGPVISPVIGGYLAQEAGWRWIFWLITIVSGGLTLLTFAILRETYAPVIARRHANKLHKSSKEITEQPANYPNATQLLMQAITRPTKLLFLSPVAAILALLISLYYSYLYFLFTTFTPVFETQYNFSTGEAGLAFLGLGVGLVLGVISVGAFAEKHTKPRALKQGRAISPEDRLSPVVVGAILFPAGLIWYGWTAHFRVHWIVPMIGTSFVGYGGTLAFLPVQMYLVDAFQLYAASAIAMNTVARNIVGATLPLAGSRLYGSLGLGWGNTLLGLICVAIIPVPILFLKHGKMLRNNPRFQVRLD